MTTPRRAARDTAAADRRAAMLRLYATGHTQADIAAQYGITQQAVSEQIRKAIASRPVHAVNEYRAIELEKLDAAERAVLGVLNRRHVTVSNGQIVMVAGPDGEEPLLDDAPVLKAVDRLVQISKRRAALLGLDAPTRVSVEAEQLGAEITELLAQVAPDDDGSDG